MLTTVSYRSTYFLFISKYLFIGPYKLVQSQLGRLLPKTDAETTLDEYMTTYYKSVHKVGNNVEKVHMRPYYEADTPGISFELTVFGPANAHCEVVKTQSSFHKIGVDRLAYIDHEESKVAQGGITEGEWHETECESELNVEFNLDQLMQYHLRPIHYSKYDHNFKEQHQVVKYGSYRLLSIDRNPM